MIVAAPDDEPTTTDSSWEIVRSGEPARTHAMSECPDYYKLLHVQPDAPDEVIKASYRTLMQRLGMHPDLGGDHATAVLINEAFTILSDPAKRAAYDQTAGERPSSGHSHRRAAASSAPRRAGGPDRAAAVPTCTFCRTICSAAQLTDPEAVCGQCGAALCPARPTLPDEHSRRALDRLPRHMALTFVPGTARTRIRHGITEDLSPGGMRFTTADHLSIDERLLIECGFCSAVAVVRSVRHVPRAPQEWEIGVQFVTMRVKRQRGGLLRTEA
jgi:hypothetical protein